MKERINEGWHNKARDGSFKVAQDEAKLPETWIREVKLFLCKKLFVFFEIFVYFYEERQTNFYSKIICRRKIKLAKLRIKNLKP